MKINIKRPLIWIFLILVCKGAWCEETTYTGVVSWFDKKAGYGFITDANKEKIFVHFSVIESKDKDTKSLIAGQRVVFQFKTQEGKKRASWVKVVAS